MGLPRIIFNSKNVDFTNGTCELRILPIRSALRNTSASGKSETLNIQAGFSVYAYIRNLKQNDGTDADLKMALHEASLWADYGGAWVFAYDRSITVNTTLDGVLLSGGTSVPVTSATGVTSGNRYAIETAEHSAVVEATNSATDPVTISPSVNFDFPSGSRFRAFDYLPMVGSIKVIDQRPMFFYDVEISGVVDKRAL